MSPTMPVRNDDDGRRHQIVDEVDKQQLQHHVLLFWAGLLLISQSWASTHFSSASTHYPLGFHYIHSCPLIIIQNSRGFILPMTLWFFLLIRASPHYSQVSNPLISGSRFLRDTRFSLSGKFVQRRAPHVRSRNLSEPFLARFLFH